MLDDKEGNPEKRSLDESQSGILEKHIMMARRSAINLDFFVDLKDFRRISEKNIEINIQMRSLYSNMPSISVI